ncbi:MAG: MBL fold metallo-hydrolase [Lachnospiraceae bacterium]|nr:MBL fold metallo-hydrolase [Lachnospiraceae bacterium]
MKIICLMENTAQADNILSEHGFSLYVETENHKLLIDAGQSPSFAENAKTLGVDLSKVDMAMLSHGHYDHSGGLMRFAQINNIAPIYMQVNAGGEYYHTNDTLEKYIGIDKEILKLPQVKLVDGNMRIDQEISMFAGVKGRKYFPSGNSELTRKLSDGTFVQDDFSHEQYVVVEEDGKKVLISGCAHNGILNILDEFKKLYGCEPDMVISGFHLMKKTGYSGEDVENIKSIAEELVTMDTTFYTGHCTGVPAFDIMKEIMGDKLHYIHSGDEI